MDYVAPLVGMAVGIHGYKCCFGQIFLGGYSTWKPYNKTFILGGETS